MITWDDIGCDYGEQITVVTISGKRFTGMLVDFETDYDGEDGGDSISVKTPDGATIGFKESTIAKMIPVTD